MNQFFTSEPGTYKPHDEKISLSAHQAASTSACVLSNNQPCSNGPVQCTSSTTCSSSSYTPVFCSNSYSKDSEALSHFEPTPTTSSSSSLIDDRPSTSAIETVVPLAEQQQPRKLKSSRLSFATKPSTLAKLRRIANYHPRILRKLGITSVNVRQPKEQQNPPAQSIIRLPQRLSPSPPPPPRKLHLNFKSPFKSASSSISPQAKLDRSQQPIRALSRNTPNSIPDATMMKAPSTPATPQGGRQPQVASNESTTSNICQESPLLVNLLSSNTPQTVMPPPPTTPQTPRYPPPQPQSFVAQPQQQMGMRPTAPMQQQQPQQIVYAPAPHPQAQQMMAQQQAQQTPMHNPYATMMARPPMPQQPPGGHPMQHMPPQHMMAMQPMVVAANESPPPKAKRKRPTKKQKEQMEQQKAMQQQQQQGMMVAHPQMSAQEFYMLQQQQRVPPVNMHLPQNMQPPQRIGYPPQYPPSYPQQQASTSMMQQGQFGGQQHGYPPGTVQAQGQQAWHHNPNIPPHMVGQPMSADYQQQMAAAAHQQHLIQQQQAQGQPSALMHRPPCQQQPQPSDQQQPHTPLPHPQTPTSAYPSPSPMGQPQDKLRMPPPGYSPQFAPNRPFMVQTPPAYPQGQGPFGQQGQQPQTPQPRGGGAQQQDFSNVSDTMDFSDNMDDLMATISGGDADDFDLDSIEPTVVHANPMSSPPQQPMMMQQQAPPNAQYPPQSPAHGYVQSPTLNGPAFHVQTPPKYMQPGMPSNFQGMKQQTPTTPTETESPGGKKAQAQQKKVAAANRNTNISSTIDAVLEMVSSKNVDEVGDILAETEKANANYASNASFLAKPPEKKAKKSSSQSDLEANKKHSNGGPMQQHVQMMPQGQKMVYDTNGGSSAYMNADYGGQGAQPVYAHFNGHIGNHAVEGQMGVTQNIFTPPPGMESRAELTFKMPDLSMPNMHNAGMPPMMAPTAEPMPADPPPKKAASKKNRKKSELAKVTEVQAKEEQDQQAYYAPEPTNG